MRSRTAWLAGLWIASVVPLAWPGSAERLSGASRMALAILPWLVASGSPRIAERPAAPPTLRAGGWSWLALALPCAALGLRLDVASGFELRERVLVAGASLLFASLLAGAARRAARSTGAHASHAVAWIVLVPGLPLLMLALGEAGRPLLGEPSAALRAVAGASPVSWLWSRVARLHGNSGVSAGDVARAAGPLFVCIALWLFSARPRGHLGAR